MYAPDNTLVSPADMHRQWVPNFQKVDTTNLQGPVTPTGSHPTSPVHPRKKMSPQQAAAAEALLQAAGVMASPSTSPAHAAGSAFAAVAQRSPTSRSKRARSMDYSPGHGSATLSMEAQEGQGLPSRKHLRQRQQQLQQKRQQQRQRKQANNKSPGKKTRMGILQSGDWCNIWLEDDGWMRDHGGHGDKMRAIVKSRRKDGTYELLFPDKTVAVFERSQIIRVPKDGEEGGGAKKGGDDGWNAATEALTHDHFFGRAVNYKPFRTEDSQHRERMKAKRRVQMQMQSRKARAEAAPGINDPVSYEQNRLAFRTMPGTRFLPQGLFPNTAHDPMADFENGEGRTGREIIGKARRKFEENSRKRKHFADNFQPSGRDVAEKHVHDLLKQRVASERSHELARMVISNDLESAKRIVREGADPNLQDWMDFDRTALHYAAMFGSLESVVWLVEEAGADPGTEDSTRATPLQLAEQRGRPEVATYLGQWTQERLRALAEARATASEEAKKRADARAKKREARKSLMFLGDITKHGIKGKYSGPDIDGVSQDTSEEEHRLVNAITALKRSKMGSNLNFMELARMLRPKVGDAWSDRVWDAMRAVIVPSGPEEQEGEDDDDEDEDLIAEAMQQLANMLGGALQSASLKHDSAGPEADTHSDADSDHGDEMEMKAAKKRFLDKSKLPENEEAKLWRKWVKRREERKRQLLPVDYENEKEAEEEIHETPDDDGSGDDDVEEVEIEEEIMVDGAPTVIKRWVKRKKEPTTSKAATADAPAAVQIVTKPAETPEKAPKIDPSTQAFAQMALQCLLKGSALNAKTAIRSLGMWARPGIAARFHRWHQNAQDQIEARRVIGVAVSALERFQLKSALRVWNEMVATAREFLRRKELLWRVISYKTRKATERAWRKLQINMDWEEEVSFDGGKTWTKQKMKAADDAVKKRRMPTRGGKAKKRGKRPATPSKRGRRAAPVRRPVQRGGVNKGDKARQRKRELEMERKQKLQQRGKRPGSTGKVQKVKQTDGSEEELSTAESSGTDQEGTAAVAGGVAKKNKKAGAEDINDDATSVPPAKTSIGWWNNSVAKKTLEVEARPKREPIVVAEADEAEKQEAEDEAEEEEEKTQDDRATIAPAAPKKPAQKKMTAAIKAASKTGKATPKKKGLPRKSSVGAKKKPPTQKKKKKQVASEEDTEDDTSEEESSSEEESDTDEESSDDEDESDIGSSSSAESSSAESSSELSSRVPPSVVAELRAELMVELKKSQAEAEDLRKTVNAQSDKFEKQEDIIARQQAQIKRLVVAKEAAEVAQKRQEKMLVQARKDTENAVATGKELAAEAREEAMREMRKQAAMALSGAAFSTAAAFTEAKSRRRRKNKRQGAAQADGGVLAEEEISEDDQDTEDDDEEENEDEEEEASAVGLDTGDEGGDESEGKDPELDVVTSPTPKEQLVPEENTNDGLIKVVRRVKKSPEKLAVEALDAAESSVKAETSAIIEEDGHDALQSAESSASERASEGETDESAGLDDEDDEEDDDSDEGSDGEDDTPAGKAKRKRRKRRNAKKKKSKKRRAKVEVDSDEEDAAAGSTREKKVRAKLDMNGVTLKRGKGFQLPKYHVRQFRHPKEMEMMLLRANKTIDQLTIKLEQTTEALHHTQEELTKLRVSGESGAASAIESAAEGTFDESGDKDGEGPLFTAEGLPTARRQEQVKLVLNDLVLTVSKTLKSIGSARRTPRSGKNAGKGEKKKGEDGGEADQKLNKDEARSYARQLEKWLQEKLERWDNDPAFRKKRKKKHKSREGFEKNLRAKTASQLKAASQN